MSETNSRRVNFSGLWRLNQELSHDLMRQPTQVVMEWLQRDPVLEVTHRIEQGGKVTERTYRYYTDGREVTNETPNGTAYTKAFWRGDSLIMVTTQQMPWGELVVNHRYRLLEEGKKLLMERYLPEHDDEVVASLVFERIEAANAGSQE